MTKVATLLAGIEGRYFTVRQRVSAFEAPGCRLCWLLAGFADRLRLCRQSLDDLATAGRASAFSIVALGEAMRPFRNDPRGSNVRRLCLD